MNEMGEVVEEDREDKLELENGKQRRLFQSFLVVGRKVDN